MAEQQTSASVARQPKAPKPLSAAQRYKQATQSIINALSATDEKAAVTAVLEFVNERLVWDSTLRQSLRQRYDELATLIISISKAPMGPAPKPLPTARKTYRNTDINRFDPYLTLEDFGHDQLRAALNRETQRSLRSAVEVVQARNPGTAPHSRTRNQDMIDYIVEHVAGPGY